MSTFRPRIGFAAALLALAPTFALAPMPAAAQFVMPAMELRKIAPDVYTMQHPFGSSNASFVVTPDGVLVFDADIRTADQTMAAIRKTTDKKVRYVVISHPSGDHATGAWHFREDKPIVIGSRKQMRDLYQQERAEFLERRGSAATQFIAYKHAELVHPEIGFDDALTLQFGGLTFQIVEEGSAHSTSDVTMFVPQRRVIMMGDLLNTEIHPGPGESAQVFFSNARNWITLIDRIIARQLPVDTYIPGHGPVHIGRGVADLEEQRRYFIVMRDAVSKMIMAGKSVDEIQKEFQTPKEFVHYRGPQRQRAFLNLFYHQLLERGFWP
jgi:glyoxylase-like metal-dependent hydrolase (beta-lactamase superfamily II)